MNASRRNIVATIATAALLAATDVSSGQSNPFRSDQPSYPDWSAFTEIKWEDDRPIVEFDGQWYELVSFHGVTTDELLEACRRNGWDAEKRVAEDLVQIVRLMGHEIDKTTDLVLKDSSGERVALTGVVMTADNLNRLKRSLRPATPSIRNQQLTGDQIREDIEAFQRGLEAQFAYLRTNDVDYQSLLTAILHDADDSRDTQWLAKEL